MDTAYSLTRHDAQTRSENLNVTHIDVHIDIRNAPQRDTTSFPVTSTIQLRTHTPTTFIDCAGTITSIHVNDDAWPYTQHGTQVFLHNLPTNTELTITVKAHCHYSRTGEGLHRYFDPEDGRTYLYTQFEPTDAHRAWPCFDQPDIKPEWTFHVDAPHGWIVTSNGATTQTQTHDNTTTWHFSQTPPLSSYITALVAGEYAVIDGGHWQPDPHTITACPDATALRIPLRLMCRQSLAPHMDADDILTVTRQGLDYFHTHYRVAYPWGTYDQIYVPEYNLGAMENPGCVTFNERMLSRDTPTFAQRQSRANVILHEMCHMWFGDLATPQWWDDLWLKESFADNQGTMAAAEATQYTGEWASFAIERKAWAYQQDLYPTTHPIAADIPDVDAAKNNFDGITYAKGAAVLKQLVAWVGRDAFFNAAHRYFTSHSFAATTLGDLLNALAKETGTDLSEWERLWLHTTGPSELSATWASDPDGRVHNFTLHHTTENPEHLTRPHQLIVSTYTWENDTLKKTHSFPVRIESDHAAIDPDGILNTPGADQSIALVLINDDDLTYAVTRFDERSTHTALRGISTIQDNTSRALAWSTLWLAVRDGLLPAPTYVEAVLHHAPKETDDSVLERLITTLNIAISQYTPARHRDTLRTQCIDVCHDVLRRDLSDDRRRQWAALLITALRSLQTLTAQQEELLQAAGQGQHPQLPATQAMRWQALTAMAARGIITQETLDAALANARTGEAEVHHVRASAAAPNHNTREHHWERVINADISNEHLSATLDGLQLSVWEGTELHDAFFNAVRPFWESHSIGMGIRFVRAGFPTAVDTHTPELSTELLAKADHWLHEHADAPHALRRLMLERRDDLRRALHAQQSSAE